MANYRAKKAGMNLAAQKKLEEKYDVLEKVGIPEKIVEWIHAAVGSEHMQCANTQWRRIQNWMRDGIVLCKLINKLREKAGMAPIKFQGNAHVQVVAQDNIDTFCKAAVEYGVSEKFIFPGIELYEAHKGTFFKVVLFINELGSVANKKGFSPQYQYVEPPIANDTNS